MGRQRRSYSRSELRSLFTRGALEGALRKGTVLRILPDTYVLRAQSSAPEVVGHALCAWWSDAVVTGELALAIHRGEGRAPRRPMIVVPHHRRSRAPRWIRVRCAYPFREDRLVGGVRVTSPAVAVLDAWRESPARLREDAVYRALWDGLCTAVQIYEAQLAQPRLVDRARLRALLAHFVSGATSPLEVLAKTRVLTGAEFAALEWQPELSVRGRQRFPDALHREARVVIELDGWKFHSRPERRERDRFRDIDFAAEGYIVLHFTMTDLLTRADWVRKSVLDALRAGLAARAV
jgi:very-short-patch-repair endonuclease